MVLAINAASSNPRIQLILPHNLLELLPAYYAGWGSFLPKTTESLSICASSLEIEKEIHDSLQARCSFLTNSLSDRDFEKCNILFRSLHHDVASLCRTQHDQNNFLFYRFFIDAIQMVIKVILFLLFINILYLV